jgi:hypothetical protein
MIPQAGGHAFLGIHFWRALRVRRDHASAFSANVLISHIAAGILREKRDVFFART